MTICFDIDGVIVSIVPDNDYSKGMPLTQTVSLVNELYESGCHIVLHTARGSKTGRDWQAFTRQQLAEFGVKYHELFFGKPAADWYVDDRMLGLTQLPDFCEKRRKGGL